MSRIRTPNPRASHIDRGRNWVVVEGPSLKPHCGSLSSMGKTSPLVSLIGSIPCQKSTRLSQPRERRLLRPRERRDDTKEQWPVGKTHQSNAGLVLMYQGSNYGENKLSGIYCQEISHSFNHIEWYRMAHLKQAWGEP